MHICKTNTVMRARVDGKWRQLSPKGVFVRDEDVSVWKAELMIQNIDATFTPRETNKEVTPDYSNHPRMPASLKALRIAKAQETQAHVQKVKARAKADQQNHGKIR